MNYDIITVTFSMMSIGDCPMEKELKETLLLIYLFHKSYSKIQDREIIN